MLDTNQIDILNIVENWLNDFNQIIEKYKILNENNSDLNLSSVFHEDSHWRDILALTWKIQTVSGKSKVIENLYNKIMDVSAKSFEIDQQRTLPREVIRAGKNVIEVILRFKTKFGNCEGVVRLFEDQERKGFFKAWSLLTALSDLSSSDKKNNEILDLISKLNHDRSWLLQQIDQGRWTEIREELAALERELGHLLTIAAEKFD